MPKCDKDCNTPKVLEIHNHECPVLFHRVVVPAAIGDDETNPPRNGQYRNVLLVYEANGHVYLFSSDGIPTFISDGGQGVDDYNELENKPSINGHELIGDSSLEDIGVTDAIDDALEDYTPTADLAAVALSGDYNDLSNTPTIPVVNDATLTITRNNVSAGTFTANSATDTSINIAVPTATSDLTNDSGFITNTADDLVNYYTKTETDSAIGVETSNREDADQGLQEQIDALASASDVVDVVGTYAELQAYDTSHLNDNDIIKVLTDETHNNAISYYRWDTDTDTFSYIGSQGPFYTKAESDATFVPQTRTVNNKALSTNITLTAADVGALPDSTVIPTVNDATLTIQKEGSSIGTFTANSATNTTINVVETDPTVPSWAKQPTKPTYSYSEITNKPTIPTKTSDLTNDGSDGTSTYVESDDLATVATSGSYNDLSNKPTIPAAQVNSDWNAASGVAQILNKPNLATVATSGSYNDLTDKPTIDFELVEMSYGESNAWAKFIAAYQGHKIVYCRASSNSNPGTGSQTRKAFMAYVNNAENPTEAEFQYVRSVSSKTASQPVDQVFVYKLTSANGGTWTVETRNMGPKLAQGTNTTVSYSNGTYTISAAQPTVNNATLTIQKEGTSVGTFTANASTNSTVNIIETDPTVPAWAKASSKPTYTWTEITNRPTNVSAFTNDAGYLTSVPTATTNSLGVVQVGSGLAISSGGVLSATGGGTADDVAWGHITGTMADQTDLTTALAAKANSADLATVATSGDYDDLTDKPTIGNATLTIQKNGTSAGTFTANATSNKTINITVPTTAADVSALPASTKYGASITVTIDPSDYKVTTTLKDQDGNRLGPAQTIDLPLESVVVNGRYDSTNKKIVLTLQSGSTIDIPVGDLIAGLQTEITSTNKLSSDLVDDTNHTHKFVTAAQITKLNGIAAGAEVNVQSDWNQTTTTADDYIKNKPSLATVATSGSYNDLSNKPTIGNATITIQKNGSSVGTFTTNATSNKSINIAVPTATSDLTNDSGFITSITKITNAEIDAIMGVS